MSERGPEAELPPAEVMSYAAPDDLARVRAFVRLVASGHGLADDRLDMLVVAVNELAMNTLQHTAGGGQVRLWARDGQVLCDVVDAGAPRTFGPMPPADSVRGRGLALVRRIADEVTSWAGRDGGVVRIRMAL